MGVEVKSGLSQLENGGKPPKTNSAGKTLIYLTGGLAAGLTAICLPFAIPAFRRFCLPFVPATDSQLANVLKALNGSRGHLVDLGSGDGRIVLAAAKIGLKADGVELNPWLVLYSRIEALRQGFWSSVSYYRQDLWKFSLRNYQNVVIFGVDQMMADLEKKLLEECGGAKIVACRFPLPNMKPLKTIGSGIDTVWVYEVGRHV